MEKKKLSLFLIFLVLLLAGFLFSPATADPTVGSTTPEIIVGVKPGDWAGYGVSVEYAANWPGLEQEPPEKNVSWVSMEILDVQNNNVTIRGSTLYANRTEETEVFYGDLAIGERDLGVAIIPANLGAGDEIPANRLELFFEIGPPLQHTFDLVVNGTTTRKYAGANREVNYINFSTPAILLFNATYNITIGACDMSYYWDKNTGVLCEHSTSCAMAYGTELYINGSLLWRMTATNMWPAVFTVQDGYTFDITMLSNSTISAFNFSESLMQISFNVTGPSDKDGYCKVTIPNELLQGSPWTILLNSFVCLFSITENATHTTIYIPYTWNMIYGQAISTNTIEIKGTSVIPEFPHIVILLLLVIGTLAAIVSKRKVNKKTSLVVQYI